MGKVNVSLEILGQPAPANAKQSNTASNKDVLKLQTNENNRQKTGKKKPWPGENKKNQMTSIKRNLNANI